MPSSYLHNSHTEGFFSEEERSRRQKVLERFPTISEKLNPITRQSYGADIGNEIAFNNSSKEYQHKIANLESQKNAEVPETSYDQEMSQMESLNPELQPRDQEYSQYPENSMPPFDMLHVHPYDESSIQAELLNDRDLRNAIATRAFYTSTTQKLYQGIDWDSSKSRRPDPPSTVVEPRPDMVSQRIRRYETKPETWQKFTRKPFAWDYLQTRNGHYLRRPFAFTSQSNKIGQIPNYTGHVSGQGEKDVEGESFTPLTELRVSKPRYTITSKRGYVPGYTGCVLWANPKPPFSTEKEPRRESTARVHKPLNQPRIDSAFKHQGPLSRMVTLTHPFNPYNKLQPANGRTASGNRV